MSEVLRAQARSLASSGMQPHQIGRVLGLEAAEIRSMLGGTVAVPSVVVGDDIDGFSEVLAAARAGALAAIQALTAIVADDAAGAPAQCRAGAVLVSGYARLQAVVPPDRPDVNVAGSQPMTADALGAMMRELPPGMRAALVAAVSEDA